jgi:hypothetical protein
VTIDTRKIWEEVKANRAKLDACPRHRFTGGDTILGLRIGQKMTCTVCGGQMELTDVGQYIRGYEAAGKPADDIWPGFRGKK